MNKEEDLRQSCPGSGDNLAEVGPDYRALAPELGQSVQGKQGAERKCMSQVHTQHECQGGLPFLPQTLNQDSSSPYFQSQMDNSMLDWIEGP